MTTRAAGITPSKWRENWLRRLQEMVVTTHTDWLWMRMVSHRCREPVIKPEVLRIQVMRIRAKP